MISTPKSLRSQIVLVGRTNVGKSSLLNFITNQEISIVSPIAGTTTDIVEKPIELHPIGPVTFLDTGGIDDASTIAKKRLERTRKALERADVVIFVLEPNIFTPEEVELSREIKQKEIPLIYIINKSDLAFSDEKFLSKLKEFSSEIIELSCLYNESREFYTKQIIKSIQSIFEQASESKISLIGDILPPGGFAIFIVPIDSQAPKGRLILPQVQAIRDALDNNSAVLVLKDSEYSKFIQKIPFTPDLVVCDSQVVHKMVSETPQEVKCTTFSILFARYKGDLQEFVRGAININKLMENDNILIAEACSHHPLQDDIGRVKIPHLLQRHIGKKLNFQVVSGRDFPEDLTEFRLIIHCGSCMLTRKELINRITKAKEANVPITNYGVVISLSQGVLERVLSPFPKILEEYRHLIPKKVLNL
ncbi:MAG: [FeFe] hydrogenase H-cluster maturation GTPase HydF [Candidatus Kapaibacteriales bacterium]